MDTVHPEDSNRILPSARELLLHVEDRPTIKSSSADDPSLADKMQIDEPYEASNSREPLPHNDQDSITKPHLPSITNAQPCSPIPRASSPSQQQQSHSALSTNHHLSDEYLRHRMSDMSVSVPSPQQRGTAPLQTTVSPRAMSPAHDVSGRALSQLEPNSQHQHQQHQQHQHQQQYYESYSRRGSITDPMLHINHNNSPAPPLEFRRPSITDLNNLPLPTSSASASRRGSMATVVTDYDYSSRSPSPSPFAKRGLPHESDYLASRRDSLPHPGVAQTQQSYDPFQRRHSIATAEVPPNNRLGSSAKYRAAFRFPATIPEAPNHGPYSAPSSPPQSGPTSFDNPQSSSMAAPSDAQRYSRHNSRYASSSSNEHHYQYAQRSSHPYANGSSSGSGNGGGGPLLHHRRRSILMDEGAESGPVLARRASMPVVGLQGNHHPGMHRHHDAMQHEGYHSNYAGSGAAHHHGSMDEDKAAASRKAETPYSRSPELRVSHKLAERKRRKEMKELFDELRDSLPVEKNLKTSKWEILSKAVEYISLLKRRDFEMENEVTALRREVGMLKRDREGNAVYGPPY